MSFLCALVAARLSLTGRDVGAWGAMAIAGGVFDILLAIVFFGDTAK